MSRKIDEDELYDVTGVAKLLGVTERSARSMLFRGDLNGKKIGRRWYIIGSAIKAHFNEVPKVGKTEKKK